MKLNRALKILILLFATSSATAAENAAVLPKGINRVRVVGVMAMPVTDKINEDGNKESLTASLNRSVTIQNMIESTQLTNPAQAQQMAQLVGALNEIRPGLGNQLVGSNLYAEAELNQSIVMPAFERGITDNLTLGLRLPVVNRSASTTFSAQTINNAYVIRSGLGSLAPSQLTAGLDQFADQNLDTDYYAKQIFTAKGYDVPHSYNKTEIGDLEFGGKYRLINHKVNMTSLQGGFRAPTGSRPSRTNILDRGTGNGAWGSAVQLFSDFFPLQRSVWTIGTMVKGVYNFPDSYETAVPRYRGESLPSVRDEDGQWRTVDRQQSPEFWSEVSTTLKSFNSSMSTWVAYQYMTKGRDSFGGSGDLYYDGLADGTDVEKQAVEFGIGYSSLPAYRAKKFPVPFQIDTMYNQTVAGRNTPLASYVRVDLISFF